MAKQHKYCAFINYKREKVVARMSCISFDTLWQRFRLAERTKERVIATVVLAFIFLSCGLTYASRVNFLLSQTDDEITRERNGMLLAQSRAVAKSADELIGSGDILTAMQILLEVIPDEDNVRPYCQEAERSLRTALLKYYTGEYKPIVTININNNNTPKPVFSTSGDFFTLRTDDRVNVYRTKDGVHVNTVTFPEAGISEWCFSKDDASIIAGSESMFYRINLLDSETSLCCERPKCSNIQDIHAFAHKLDLGNGKTRLLVPLLSGLYNIEDRILCVSDNLKWILYESDNNDDEQTVLLLNTDTNDRVVISNGSNGDDSDFNNKISDAKFSPDGSELAYITYGGRAYKIYTDNPIIKTTTAYDEERGGMIYNRVDYLSSGDMFYAYSDHWKDGPVFYKTSKNGKNRLDSHNIVSSSHPYEAISSHPSDDNIFVAGLRGKYQIFQRNLSSPFFTMLSDIHSLQKEQTVVGDNDSLQLGEFQLKYTNSTISVFDREHNLIWSQGDCSDIRVSQDGELVLYNVFIRPNDFSAMKYVSSGTDYLGDFYSIYDKKYDLQEAWFNGNRSIVNPVDDEFCLVSLMSNADMILLAKELTKGRTLTANDKTRFFLQ